MNVFESNAARMEELRRNVDEAFLRRRESRERMAAWEKAAKAFHEEYDRLAFPGGLGREFQRLKAGDPEAIEMAVRFLEANPWYFRSGYHKAEMLNLLRKHSLSEDQCARLRKVILDRVRGRSVREMRDYARLAPKIRNLEFETKLSDIATNSERTTARHARWVLEYLKKPGSPINAGD